jgi:hypothetical protein
MGGVFRRDLENDKKQMEVYQKLEDRKSKAAFRQKWALQKAKAHSNYVLVCM